MFRLSFALVIGLAAAASIACGADDGDDRAPPLAPNASSGNEQKPPVDLTDVAPVPCETGTTRTCKVVLSRQGGVENCFEGVQVCIDATWGPCGESKDAG